MFKFREEHGLSRSSSYTRRDEVDLSVVNNVHMEVTIGGEREITSGDDCMNGIEPLEQDAGVQRTLLGTFYIDNLINDPKRVHYYTSFEYYDHFMLFYHCLGPAVHKLNYQCQSLSLSKRSAFSHSYKVPSSKRGFGT